MKKSFANTIGLIKRYAGGGTGGGDMYKSTYDSNGNNIVDRAESLDGVLTSDLIQKSEIVNSLTDSSTNKPLSANQGKVLSEKINSMTWGV